MDLTKKIGYRVVNKRGEEGTIVEVNDHIKVDFGSKTALFPMNTFIKGFLSFKDETSNNEVAEAIKQAEQEETKIVVSAQDNKRDGFANMFGKDYHVEHLRRQPILTYQQVESQFGIKISGFGRGINITDESIVLISSMEKKAGSFVYHDHWTEDGDYIYSGEGKTGDQKLTKGNLAIANAADDRKTIYLFVKFSPKEYYFQGKVTCVDYFSETEKDESGCIRKEYKFILRKSEE